MNRFSWSQIQSLKSKARIPVSNFRKIMRWRNMEKNLSRKVFSRGARMQLAKPSTDMTPPTSTNSHTRPLRSVIAEMVERMNALLTPGPEAESRNRTPSTQKTVLKPNRQCFSQQQTSGAWKCWCVPA